MVEVEGWWGPWANGVSRGMEPWAFRMVGGRGGGVKALAGSR